MKILTRAEEETNILILALAYERLGDTVYLYAEGYEGGGEWTERALVVTMGSTREEYDVESFAGFERKQLKKLFREVRKHILYNDDTGQVFLKGNDVTSPDLDTKLLGGLSRNWPFNLRF